jgi:hypothetical protein
LVGLVGGAILGAIIAVAAGAFSATSHKVVKVIVTAPKPIPSPAAATSPSSLPPASAGSNGSSSPQSSDVVLRSGARGRFAQFAAALPGHVDVALAPVAGSQVVVLGSDTPAHGWSTTKIPVLAALLLARGARGLTPAEQQWAQLAVTESDNQSILNLFGDLESLEGGLSGASGYVQRLFRRSGDDQTVVATAPPPPGAVTTFGQTEWSPGESVKFFRALARGCLISRSQASYVLGLMQRIVPSESWGLGAASFGAPVAFKGGWGPERSGYLVRQSGVVDPGSPGGVAVSIVAYPPVGGDSFGVGTQMVTQTAQWLSREIVLTEAGGASC